MQNKHPLITNAYHFLSEAMIIFLMAVPVMYYNYDEWIPYWSYLAVVVAICMVFSVYSRYVKIYGWYILTAPFIGLLFYMLDYPIIISVVFSILLTWRYINIVGEASLSRENGYVISTFLLGGVLILLINEPQIIIYVYLQFVILIFGYVSSHLFVIKKEERKQFNNKVWAYIVSAFAVGSALFFLLFDYGRLLVMKVMEGIIFLASFVFSKVAHLLGFIDLGKANVQKSGSSDLKGQKPKVREELGQSLIEKIAPYFYWGAVILILGFLIILAVKFFKKRTRDLGYDDVSEAVSYSRLDGKVNKNSMKDRYNRLFNRPVHPARKLVYQFEHNATKNGYGRHSFETIEEWFGRLNLNADLMIYQQVRYGGTDISKQEVDRLKDELKTIETRQREEANLES